MTELVHVKGLSELNAFMEQLVPKMERNVLRTGLRAGAKVIAEVAKGYVPVGPTSSENAKIYGGYAGALRDSIHVSTGARGGVVTGSVIAGGKNKKTGADVYYAHMVEYGTVPHTITAANRKGLSFGGLFFQSVQHPGARARPFMRPALDTQAQAAVIAVGEAIKERLATKEGLDTSAVLIEGDEP